MQARTPQTDTSHGLQDPVQSTTWPSKRGTKGLTRPKNRPLKTRNRLQMLSVSQLHARVYERHYRGRNRAFEAKSVPVHVLLEEF